MYLFKNDVFVKTTFIYLMGLLFPNATFIYFLRLLHSHLFPHLLPLHIYFRSNMQTRGAWLSSDPHCSVNTATAMVYSLGYCSCLLNGHLASSLVWHTVNFQ